MPSLKHSRAAHARALLRCVRDVVAVARVLIGAGQQRVAHRTLRAELAADARVHGLHRLRHPHRVDALLRIRPLLAAACNKLRVIRGGVGGSRRSRSAYLPCDSRRDEIAEREVPGNVGYESVAEVPGGVSDVWQQGDGGERRDPAGMVPEDAAIGEVLYYRLCQGLVATAGYVDAGSG